MESFLLVLVSTYTIMVIAEFGDKTNLIALSLMSKSEKPYFIALMSTLGIACSTVISVLIGAFIGQNLPLDPIRYITAVIFIFLGISSLYENDELEEELEEEVEVEGEEEEEEEVPWYKPLYLVGLAEFGDKSQLFAISASASLFPLAVFIGSTLGMGTIMFATAFLGSIFFDKIDPESIEKIAALLFIIAGLWVGLSTYFG